jgi:8-amino-7-oxononanoate synthase
MADGGAIFSDELNHASIIDGARLAKATVHVYRHNDTQHLEQLLAQQRPTGRRLIVSDSVFSMDGDLADVAELARLARDYDAALLVDEAHAIGVFGNGSGLCPQHGVKPDITTGTLSKSLGSAGGFAATSAELRDYLVNKSRPFIFQRVCPPLSRARHLPRWTWWNANRISAPNC